MQAQIHKFAAIVPQDLHLLCRQELTALGIVDLELSEAGVEFAGRLSDCMRANLWLRTASRVLCRLPSFRVGVVGELHRKVAAIPWEYWLNAAVPLLIQSHASRSRVDHEGLIADTTLKAIQQRFQDCGFRFPGDWKTDRRSEPGDSGDRSEGSKRLQRLLVRVNANHCAISLDTSGVHLHQRGYRRHHTGAPLRETLAAAILLQCGWQGDRPLVDGMCGAGTAAIEAALLSRRIPPGIGREFLFELWPGHEAKTWEYLRRKAMENSLAQAPKPIVALDQDRRALGVARENAARAGVAEDIRWEPGDFLSFHPGSLQLSRGLVILDPPYGVRMEGSEDLPAFYRKLGKHLREAFQGWQVAVAAPSPELARALGFRRQRLWRISHGGIPLSICLAAIG